MSTTVCKLLADHGVTPTPQRVAVLEAMLGRKDHPSVDTVFAELKREMPTLSKTTVYSTMQLLASKRLIGELHCEDGELLFDGTTDFHAHFKCRSCGGVFDVPCKARQVASLPEGFEADHEELTFYGLCPKCKQQKKGKTQWN